ncbi:MAG: PAS domain S-box protein [Cyanophyceae cyanobacterium]
MMSQPPSCCPLQAQWQQRIIQLEQENHQQQERDRLLTTITATIRRSATLASVFQQALQVQPLLQVDQAMLIQRHPTGSSVVAASGRTLAGSDVGEVFCRGDWKPFTVDVDTDAGDSRDRVQQWQVQTLLAVPIVSWGWLAVLHQQPRQWSADIDLLERVATLLEIAVEQSRARRSYPGGLDCHLPPQWPLELQCSTSGGFELLQAQARQAELQEVRQLLYKEIELRQQAEEALMQERKLTQAVLEIAALCVMVLDTQGRILYFNPACERITGYCLREVEGQPWWEFVLPEEVAASRAAFRRFDTEQYRTCWVAKDGSHRQILWSNTVVLNHGESEHVISTGIDVTEYQQVEAELRVRASQQAAIAQLGQQALAEPNLEGFMADATALVARTLDIQYARILELLPHQGELRAAATYGWEEDVPTVRADRESQAGYAFMLSETVVIEDLRRETRFYKSPFLRKKGAISGMSVVIRGKDEPYGILDAYSTRQRQFSQDDANFIQAIANVIATAVERQRTEAELNRFFNLSLDMFCIAGTDGYFKRINPRFEDLGYSEIELLSTSFLDFVHLEDIQATLEQLETLALGQAVPKFENRYRCRDGSYRWLSWTSIPYSDRLFCAVARDVTESKRLEDALRNLAAGIPATDGEAFFQSLVQYLAQSLNTEYAFVGELAQPDQIRTVAVCADGAMVTNFAYDLPDTPCQGVVRGQICLYPNRVQQRFPQDELLAAMQAESYVGAPLTGSTGKVLGLIAVLSRKPLRDLALIEEILHLFAVRAGAELERRQAETALRNSEEKFRQLAEHIREVFFIISTETDQFLYISPTFKQIWGVPCEILYQQPHLWYECVYPEDRDRLAAILTGQPESASLEYRIYRTNGETGWISMRTFPVADESGHIYRLVGIAEDITERKRSASALIKRERYLAALVEIQNCLLGGDPTNFYSDILEILGQCAEVSCVYWFENYRDLRGQCVSSQKAEWCAPEVTCRLRTQKLTNLPLEEELAPLYQQLSHGKTVAGLVPDTPATQSLQKLQPDTVSVLVLPISIKGEFCGWIGFDECREERTWDSLDIDLLSSAASAIALQQERQRSEVLTRQSEERFRSTFEQAAVGIAHVGVNGRWLRVNQKLCDILGYDREELLTLTFQDLTHADDLVEDLHLHQQILTGTITTYSLEKRYIHKDDYSVWINLTVSLVREETGEPKYFIAVVEEISDRKQAETALQASERRYATLVQAVPVGIFRTDAQGNCIYVNEQAREIAGCHQINRRDSWGITCDQPVHPNDQERVLSQWSQSLHNQLPFSCEYRLLQADNSTVWVYVQALPEISDAGLVGYVGTITDVSPRKQAEQGLQQLNEQLEVRVEQRTAELQAATTRLASLIEALQVGVVVQDEHELVVLINQAFCDIFKFPVVSPALIGADFADFAQDYQHYFAAPAQFQQRYCEIRDHQQPVSSEEIQTVDGRIFERDYVPIFINQRFSGNLWMYRDVTERKQAEKAIRKSEARFRAMFEQAAVGIVQFQLDGRISRLNQKFCEIVGYSEAELVAKTCTEIIYQADVEQYQRQIQYLLAGERETFSLEQRYVCKAHKLVWVNLTASLVYENSQADYFLGVVEDISDRKRAEAEVLKTLQKEKELGELKSRFVSMTSHEFRTPLAVISSSAGLLQDYGDRLQPHKRQKHLNRIQTSVQHMTQLLNDVLTVNQAEVNQLEIEPTPVELVEFCQNLTEELQSSFSSHTLLFTAHVDSASHNQIQAYVDRKLLRQILNNLLSNAAKYSPNSDKIYFDIFAQEQVVLKIRDQGIGIPLEDQQHLFESFHRAKNVGNISGTGLGLVIVKKCVELHRGKITIDSQVDIGTTVTVTLPLNSNTC